MGSQLFFRLACTVPLAITRLERNVFSGLFLASLISNYESETTRWAVAFAGRITLFSSPAYPFCSPRPFLESSRLSSKGSQAVTCLPDPLSSLLPPFLLSGPWRCPGRILRFATFVRSYLPSIRDFSPYPPILPPLPPLSLLSFPSSPREKNALCIYDRYLYFIAARENVRIANCCVSSH